MTKSLDERNAEMAKELGKTVEQVEAYNKILASALNRQFGDGRKVLTDEGITENLNVFMGWK